MSAEGVVILVPVLGRPHRVEPLLASIASATPEPYEVLFIADSDDEAELEALERAKASYITLDPPANYARKINEGFTATREELVFMAADDLNFHPRWFEIAAKCVSDEILVVGTLDLWNGRTMNGTHSTHTLVARRYIDERGGVVDQPPGVVLNEQYPHEYADDEFIQTALTRNVYGHAWGSVVEHLHPWAGKADDDETYRKGQMHTDVGRKIFESRRALFSAIGSVDPDEVVYAEETLVIHDPRSGLDQWVMAGKRIPPNLVQPYRRKVALRAWPA